MESAMNINRALLLCIGSFSSISYLQAAIDGVVLGYIHDTILEKNVPEYTEFKQKIREIFKAKDEGQKQKLGRKLYTFGTILIEKLNRRLQSEKLTSAQCESINTVIKIIKDKLAKYGVPEKGTQLARAWPARRWSWR